MKIFMPRNTEENSDKKNDLRTRKNQRYFMISCLPANKQNRKMYICK